MWLVLLLCIVIVGVVCVVRWWVNLFGGRFGVNRKFWLIDIFSVCRKWCCCLDLMFLVISFSLRLWVMLYIVLYIVMFEWLLGMFLMNSWFSLRLWIGSWCR